MKQGYDLAFTYCTVILYCGLCYSSSPLEHPTRDQMCHLMAMSKSAQYTQSCTRVAEKERLIFSLLLAERVARMVHENGREF